MAKKDRTGNRKTREKRRQFKVPELGYYLIVTDTEATERCFFTGLHQALPGDVRNKLVIKVVETKTRTMIDKCLELIALWCVCNFILNCLIDRIKSVHFAIIDLKTKIEYNIVKCPIIGLIKGD